MLVVLVLSITQSLYRIPISVPVFPSLNDALLCRAVPWQILAILRVCIGTSLQDVFDFCGGFKRSLEKIIMGGPMMGVAQFSMQNSILKQTNALLALTEDEINTQKEVLVFAVVAVSMLVP